MDRLESLKKGIVRKYEFTFDGGCLTPEQRDFYEENGYIVVRGLLKEEDIQRWNNRFQQYCNNEIKPLPPTLQIVKDIALAKKNHGLVGEAAVTKVQNFQFDDELFSFCSNPALLPYLKSFCGDNIKSVHTMFINKPPNMGSSSRHPFHQDLAYFPFRPANRIVAAWASLQDSNNLNGSLNIFPKTHRDELYRHIYPEWEGKVNKAYFGIDNYKEKANMRLDLEMKKGDVVFFHPLLVHGSGENKSTGYRKSMCCHFADAECCFVELKDKWQQEVAEEVLQFVTKKYGNKLKYEDIWRRKGRMVAGKEFENGI